MNSVGTLGTRWFPGVPHLAIQCHGTGQVSGRFAAWLMDGVASLAYAWPPA